MAEFVGKENHIELQKRLRDRQPWIRETPGVANGGRLLHIVDPQIVGWDKIRELAEEDELVGFPGVAAQAAIAMIRKELGAHWHTPAWMGFVGTPDDVLPACDRVIGDVALPAGWRVDSFDVADDAQLAAIQDLNAQTGVSPYPAYYSRSEAVPVVTVCIFDAAGGLVATASAADRYHPQSRLAGCTFAGMVSVSPSHQGRGLGKLVNALMLAASHDRFNWSLVQEQVAPDNAASQAMIAACGLGHNEGFMSVAAIISGESITR